MPRLHKLGIAEATKVAYVILGLSEREWDLVFSGEGDENKEEQEFAQCKILDFFGEEILEYFSATARTECLILQVFGADPTHKSTIMAMHGHVTPNLKTVYPMLGVHKCSSISDAIKEQNGKQPKELTEYLRSFAL